MNVPFGSLPINQYPPPMPHVHLRRPSGLRTQFLGYAWPTPVWLKCFGRIMSQLALSIESTAYWPPICLRWFQIILLFFNGIFLSSSADSISKSIEMAWSASFCCSWVWFFFINFFLNRQCIIRHSYFGRDLFHWNYPANSITFNCWRYAVG